MPSALNDQSFHVLNTMVTGIDWESRSRTPEQQRRSDTLISNLEDIIAQRLTITGAQKNTLSTSYDRIHEPH